MAKLTLSVDPRIVETAKKYAARRRTSLSRLVARFLEALTRPGEDEDLPPVLSRLRGSLRGTAVGEYRRYIEEKYR